ncbi:MAG TPA: tail fiber domain-containing protein, partial [Flavobacteriales bacterium]|nr:tail fiber domain-containing protein [Flavobacteriales bacterium]
VLSTTGTGTDWVDLSLISSDGDWTISGTNMYSAVTGNVGIGTTSPTQKLHVDGGANGQSLVYFYNGEYRQDGSHALKAQGSFTTNAYLGISQGVIDFDGTGIDLSGGQEVGVLGVSLGNSTSDNIGIYGVSNGLAAGRFRNTATGSEVNIATSSAGLQIVDGTEGAGKVLTSDAVGNATWQQPPSDGDWTISGNNMYSGVSGNVGIGTSTPAVELHVSGTGTTEFILRDENEPANQKNFSMRTNAGGIHFSRVNDAISGRTNYLSINSQGRIGLGKTNPAYRIGINAAGAGATTPSLGLYNLVIGMERNIITGSGWGIYLTGGGAGSGSTDEAGGNLVLGSGISTGNEGSSVLIYTATPGASGTTDRTPTEKMRIDPTGNVGIGTITPAKQLHVVGDNQSQGIVLFDRIGPYTSGLGGILQLKHTSTGNMTTGYGPAQAFLIEDNAGVENYLGDISMVRGNADNTGRFMLQTYNAGIPYVRMYIDDNGDLGINGIIAAYTFEVNGTAGKPGGGSWSTSSDRRFKENITDYNDGLEKLLKIHPVYFNYNELSGFDKGPRYVGVIAQELQEISPYMVHNYEKDDKDYLGVDNSAMTYMLINAIKEQQELIKTQEENFKELKKELEELRKLLKKRY